MNVGILGTGSCVPEDIIKNHAFEQHEFYTLEGEPLGYDNETIIQKFESITGISERRYAQSNQTASDLGTTAAHNALHNAGIDKEKIDYIIFAHNFGDVKKGTDQSDMLPSLATRVKHNLKINNPKCVCYDLVFGCPGWVEGMIQARSFILSGMAQNCLVIGGETLSRVTDPHDRDSMIYSDGAGAAILSANTQGNILSHNSATYANEEAYYLFFGKSNKPGDDNRRYIKMYGRKIYEFAITHVPQALKECLDDSGCSIETVKKIFIHQANEKMDEAIVKRFYRLYGKKVPEGVMPMIIGEMGNNSVGTVPILFDKVKKGELPQHALHKGDVIMFASVGAGMNINAIVYRV
jgi:3-oxoacyl-[acyl-carrier-protein] synthase-3